MDDVSFVAVDWGTTSFRLWAMATDGSVLAAFDGPFGMSQLKKDEFGVVLDDNLAKLGIDKGVPVVICGMAGAAQGWREAPYLLAPTRLDLMGENAIKVPGWDRDIRILPGVKQMSPANVMRGEETQIAGLLYHHPDFKGVICLPGTHTKWVRVADKCISEFETCMTGEQFALFSKHSVLSHSMPNNEWSDAMFDTSIRDALEDPASVSRKLFSIRAEMLIGNQTSAQARARLSGLLIGQELAATRPYWENGSTTVIGAAALCELYRRALKIQGGAVEVLDSTVMTLAGLTASFRTMKDQVHA